MGAARVLLGAVIAVTAVACSDVDRTRIKAHLGGTSSQVALANRYSTGRGVEKDEAEAVRWYRRAAEGGYGPAQVVMGNRYLQGAGVEADPVQARAWFRRAAEGGDPSGEFGLGLVLIKGVGGAPDPEAGAAWIQKAAAHGHPEARRVVEEATQDPAERVAGLRERAEQGEAEAQFQLSQAYLNGVGVEADEPEALHWLQRAEAQDHVGALTVLGYLYMKGQHGVAPDPARGVELYRKAAERDIPSAQHGLGLAYLEGHGVEADPAEAARWMEKAAEAGLPASQRVMARLYREGLGVPRDLTESLRWLRLAAEAGDAAAQYNLGLSFAEGIGVERDPAAALEWYERASAQGHALAQIKLGVAYLVGEGAEQDPVRSYAYFELGRRGGAPIPADGVARLNELLTDEQRSQAAVLIQELSARQGGASAGS